MRAVRCWGGCQCVLTTSLPFVCSGFFGEPDSFSMYGSNRVKRRPSPYEMEITDGESFSLALFFLWGVSIC